MHLLGSIRIERRIRYENQLRRSICARDEGSKKQTKVTKAYILGMCRAIPSQRIPTKLNTFGDLIIICGAKFRFDQ